MINLFIYIIITVGLSSIWSLSDIFLPVRNFVAKHFPKPIRKLLLCMECSSFWIGILTSLFIFPITIPTYNYPLLNNICLGIITYLSVRILNNFNILENKDI